MFKICTIGYIIIILPDGTVIIIIISKNILETSSLYFSSLRGVARETKKNRAIASSNVSKEKYPRDDTWNGRGKRGPHNYGDVSLYVCMHVAHCLLHIAGLP